MSSGRSSQPRRISRPARSTRLLGCWPRRRPGRSDEVAACPCGAAARRDRVRLAARQRRPGAVAPRCAADRAVRRATRTLRLHRSAVCGDVRSSLRGRRAAARGTWRAPCRRLHRQRGPRTVADDLLDGWAALFADGCAAATPTLRAALAQFEHAMAAADQLHCCGWSRSPRPSYGMTRAGMCCRGSTWTSRAAAAR